MRSKFVNDFLRPYSLAQVAQLHSLALEMATWGLTADDVLEICESRLEENRAEKAPVPVNPPASPQRPTATCPMCGAKVNISRVNVSKCTHVGGNWKTSLMCSNEHCRFTELSEKTLEEWRR